MTLVALAPLTIGKILLFILMVRDILNEKPLPRGDPPETGLKIIYGIIISFFAILSIVDCFVACGNTFSWPPKRRRLLTLIAVVSVSANLTIPLLAMGVACLAAGFWGPNNVLLSLQIFLPAEGLAWIYFGFLISLWIALRIRLAAFPVEPNSG